MLEALILGFVQGLTEFLPISSSAHLRILGEFLPGAQDPGAAFTAITQLGTETAVVVFFWRDIVRIVSHWFGSFTGRVPRHDPDARMGWLIIVGSIPIVVLGLLFQDEIETILRSLWITATMLIIFGIILGLADWAGAKRRKLDQLTVPHGIYFGLAQSLSLIPGVSRSGGTITMGLLPVGHGAHSPEWSVWPVAGLWQVRHLWEHLRFGADGTEPAGNFARDTAWPAIRGAAEFALDLLVEFPDGTLGTSPSTSPENSFTAPHPGGGTSRAAAAESSTMDLTLIRDVFLMLGSLAGELGLETDPVVAEAQAALPRLPEPTAGRNGRLREWLADPEEWTAALKPAGGAGGDYRHGECDGRMRCAGSCR